MPKEVIIPCVCVSDACGIKNNSMYIKVEIDFFFSRDMPITFTHKREKSLESA
jgi:hypothetical protein